MPTLTTLKISAMPLVSTFKGITKLNNGNFIASLRGSGNQQGVNTALALDNIHSALLGLNSALGSATLSVSVLIPQASVLRTTLVAGHTTTITAPLPVNNGDTLTVIVKSAGPTALLAWDSTVFRFTAAGFDSTNNKYTVWSFVGDADPDNGNAMRWFQTTIPLTGQS